MNNQHKSWPELKGQHKDAAVKAIISANHNFNIEIFPEGSFTTEDLKLNRVRIFVDAHDIVTRSPFTG